MEKEIPEITISVKFKAIEDDQYYEVRSTSDIAEVLRQIFNQDTIEWKEEFMLLCLNRSNKVIGFYRVSSGGMTGTVADPKIIYTIALNCAATTIIIAHNHPSGNLNPSNADRDLTRKIYEAGKLFDIVVLDHIIITRDKHLSFAEEGWM